MDPAFEYTRRLPEGHMRLLHLISGDPSQSLLHFQLSEAVMPDRQAAAEGTITPFTALSYVWGEESNQVPIFVDGQVLHVTQNLFSALRHLGSELAELPLWVDAVCINQLDEAEKLAQIDRMSDVYRFARRVVVFLGESDDEVDEAFVHLERIGREVFEAGAMIFKEPDIKKWPNFEGCSERARKLSVRSALEEMMDRESGGVVSRPAIPTNTILDLFGRPWFSRAWVIQEIVVARRGALTFACGPSRITWENLWAAHFFVAMWIMREAKQLAAARGLARKIYRLGVFKARTGIFPRGFSSRAAQTLGMRKRYLQNDLKATLKDLLTQLYVSDSATPLGCKEEVDKIRAIKGFATDADFLQLLMAEQQQDETKQSWQWLYAAVTRHMIREGCVDFLSLCRNRDPSLPSWVPDWTRQQRQPWLGYKTGDASQMFDAGKGTEVRIVKEADTPWRRLCLRGFFVDTICEVGTERTAGLDEELSWDSVRIRIAEIDRLLSRSNLYSAAQKKDARWRIPVGDKEANDLQQSVRATGSSQRLFLKLEQAARSPNALDAFDEPDMISYRNSWDYMYGSRPFRSEKGYVGLVPGNASVGDVIFVPSGGHCPYAITKCLPADERGEGKNDTQRVELHECVLLGEAYVHGIMDGELGLGCRVDDARDFRLM